MTDALTLSLRIWSRHLIKANGLNSKEIAAMVERHEKYVSDPRLTMVSIRGKAVFVVGETGVDGKVRVPWCVVESLMERADVRHGDCFAVGS